MKIYLLTLESRSVEQVRKTLLSCGELLDHMQTHLHSNVILTLFAGIKTEIKAFNNIFPYSVFSLRSIPLTH